MVNLSDIQNARSRSCPCTIDWEWGKFLNPHDQPGHPGNTNFPCFPQFIDDQRLQQPSYFLIEEIASNPNITQVSEQIGIDVGAWFTARGVTRLLNISLWLNEQTIGALDIWLPHDRSFNRSQIELAYTFEQQITLATYLNQLFEDAKQTVLFEERNRMAREIHDTLAQSFTSIGAARRRYPFLKSQTRAGAILPHLCLGIGPFGSGRSPSIGVGVAV